MNESTWIFIGGLYAGGAFMWAGMSLLLMKREDALYERVDKLRESRDRYRLLLRMTGSAMRKDEP